MHGAWLLLRASQPWARHPEPPEARRACTRRFGRVVRLTDGEPSTQPRPPSSRSSGGECTARSSTSPVPPCKEPVDALTRLYCYLDDQPEAAIRPAAAQRAAAMALSHQWVEQGRQPDSPLVPPETRPWSAPTPPPRRRPPPTPPVPEDRAAPVRRESPSQLPAAWPTGYFLGPRRLAGCRASGGRNRKLPQRPGWARRTPARWLRCRRGGPPVGFPAGWSPGSLAAAPQFPASDIGNHRHSEALAWRDKLPELAGDDDFAANRRQLVLRTVIERAAAGRDLTVPLIARASAVAEHPERTGIAVLVVGRGRRRCLRCY